MSRAGANRRAATATLLAVGAIAGTPLLGEGTEAEAAPVASKAGKQKYKPKLKLINDSSLRLSVANESPRAVVRCPGKLVPFGGAQHADPDPNRIGEGVYPHSYERLGIQAGFHSTPVLFAPLLGTAVRRYVVTLQVLCGRKPGKLADPHDIALNVPSGTSVTLEAKCPKRSVLIGGGFQRAAFEALGGVYPTESRAISKTVWRASGTAFGRIKNDMVSIAYCMASPKRKPLIKTVSATTTIAPFSVGFVTTPRCPRKRKMVWNGFDVSPKPGGPAQRAVLFADGIFNRNHSFTASAWNGSGVTGRLTAYGYCLKKKVIGGSLKRFSRKVGPLDKNTVTKVDQDGNPHG